MTEFIFKFDEELWFNDYEPIQQWVKEKDLCHEWIIGYHQYVMAGIKSLIGISIGDHAEALHFKMMWQDVIETHYESD